jgi:Domain of unknown function (DUF1877)
MGMYGNLKAVTIAQLNKFLTCSTPEEISSLTSDELLNTSSDRLEIDKTWQALHFLLTGSPHAGIAPASWVVFGNHSLGSEEEPIFFGWIGIRYLLPDEVQQVAQMLSQTSLETLALRYSPDKMDKLEIYPIGIWQRDGNS